MEGLSLSASRETTLYELCSIWPDFYSILFHVLKLAEFITLKQQKRLNTA
jgi:hypothetical protein